MASIPRLPPAAAPSWLRAWAVLTVAFTFFLLGLGSVVTTFRVGMEDPIWPTTPWYLFVNGWTIERPGFLIEHAHRLVAFALGGIVTLFTFFCWAYEANPTRRWVGFGALIGLLIAFGMLHREMMTQTQAATIVWPWVSILTSLSLFALVLACGFAGISSTGGSVRLGVILALGGVMVQGLLGGLRVRLNASLGPELSIVHGVMGQLVFALLTGVMVLLFATHQAADEVDTSAVRWLAIGCVVVLILQLIWGAILRHLGLPVMQRLHFLTAFVALAGFVWLLTRMAIDPAVWRTFAGTNLFLAALLGFQLLLGVETWFSKFSQGVAPEMQLPVTTISAALIRTLHVLIGALLLATATALATRMSRAKSPTPAVAKIPLRETPLVESWA